MKRRRLGFLAAITAIGLTTLVLLRAQATTSIERFAEPFDETIVNPCNGEVVHVTGELNITVRTTIDNQGNVHLSFSLVPSHVDGVGADGNTYSAVGGQREHINFSATDLSATDTFASTFNLISAGGADNFLAHATFHVTVAVDGTVKSEVEHVTTECRG